MASCVKSSEVKEKYILAYPMNMLQGKITKHIQHTETET